MADSPATAQDFEIFRDLSERVDRQLARLKEIETRDWAEFQRLVR